MLPPRRSNKTDVRAAPRARPFRAMFMRGAYAGFLSQRCHVAARLQNGVRAALFCRCDRKNHGDAQSRQGGAIREFDRCAKAAGERVDDRESEPAAFALAVGCQPSKSLERGRTRLRRDTWSFIFDDHGAVAAHRHRHGTPGAVIPDRVVDQIADQFPGQVGLGQDRDRLFSRLEIEIDAGLHGQPRVLDAGGARNFDKIDTRAKVGTAVARALGAGERQKLGQQALEPPRRRLDVGKRLLRRPGG